MFVEVDAPGVGRVGTRKEEQRRREAGSPHVALREHSVGVWAACVQATLYGAPR